jgi:uncharacterized protein YjgD (DUF1641 family)
MRTIQTEMADKVFERTPLNAEKGSKLEIHTFNILMAIDGKRSVRTIAQENMYKMDDLIDQIQELLVRGLIEPVLGASTNKNRQDFFDTLQISLRKIIGPIGDILIRDQVALLGYDLSNFPMGKTSELIHKLSESIPDREKAESFIRIMTDAINI